jgi:hypothetical protein
VVTFFEFFGFWFLVFGFSAGGLVWLRIRMEAPPAPPPIATTPPLSEQDAPLAPRRKNKTKTPKQELRILLKNQRKSAVEAAVFRRNVFLHMRVGNSLRRAHFIKSFLNEEDISALHQALEKCNYWELREDVRGDRPTTVVGEWTGRGRARHKVDPVHPAGVGGKAELTSDGSLSLILQRIGEKLSSLIELKRPDVAGVLKEYGLEKSLFGFFHLFMAPRGYCCMHRDSNDFISVCVGINTPPNLGGALEFGGSGLAFDIRKGDVLIMDSSEIYHGSRPHRGKEDPYNPKPEDRIVGIFIIWKHYLRLKGFYFFISLFFYFDLLLRVFISFFLYFVILISY